MMQFSYMLLKTYGKGETSTADQWPSIHHLFQQEITRKNRCWCAKTLSDARPVHKNWCKKSWRFQIAIFGDATQRHMLKAQLICKWRDCFKDTLRTRLTWTRTVDVGKLVPTISWRRVMDVSRNFIAQSSQSAQGNFCTALSLWVASWKLIEWKLMFFVSRMLTCMSAQHRRSAHVAMNTSNMRTEKSWATRNIALWEQQKWVKRCSKDSWLDIASF